MSNKQEISGYRALSEEEIALVNKIKAKGVEIGELVDLLTAMDSTDKRWVAIGVTDIQKGFMALNRAVTKPATF